VSRNPNLPLGGLEEDVAVVRKNISQPRHSSPPPLLLSAPPLPMTRTRPLPGAAISSTSLASGVASIPRTPGDGFSGGTSAAGRRKGGAEGGHIRTRSPAAPVPEGTVSPARPTNRSLQQICLHMVQTNIEFSNIAYANGTDNHHCIRNKVPSPATFLSPGQPAPQGLA